MKAIYQIEYIRFNNFDSTVHLSVEVLKDNFSFYSTILLDICHLNPIINQLQKNNPNKEILDSLDVQYFGDYRCYELQFSNCEKKQLDLEELDFQEILVKEVRA